MRNKFVLAIRPDVSDVSVYTDEDRNDYHISFGQTADGRHIARATVNGHPFHAIHARKDRASVLLTERIDAAEEAGATQHPKTFAVLEGDD